MASNIRKDKPKIGVHILVVIFGITSWSLMNGLWVELPILVSHLPEGWTLPSYLTIVSQFGNLGPILFSLMVYLCPSKKLETPVSVFIAAALAVIAMLYAFLWRLTGDIAGSTHSVALLSLTLVQAIFAATTSMAYLAFMAHLKACYMGSLFIGMGLSGLIPAIAALGQAAGNVRCVLNATHDVFDDTVRNSYGKDHLLRNNITSTHQYPNSSWGENLNNTLVVVNPEPSFTVRAFFLLLSGLSLMSLVSVLALLYHPYCKTEHVDTDVEENSRLMNVQRNVESNQNEMESNQHTDQDPSVKDISMVTEQQPASLNVTNKNYEDNDDAKQYRENTQTDDVRFSDPSNLKQLSDPEQLPEEDAHKEQQLTKWESWFLLGLQVWINILQTSYVLAIQVYSSLPYGLAVYHGVTKAENIVDPIACFVSMFVTAKTTRVIFGLTFLGTLFTAYIITVAAMSPNPFLLHETAGGILVIAAWVMCTLFMVYAKVSIAGVMRSQGRTSLLWTGGSTQLGSFIGALLAYVMINHLHLFKDGPWCG